MSAYLYFLHLLVFLIRTYLNFFLLRPFIITSDESGSLNNNSFDVVLNSKWYSLCVYLLSLFNYKSAKPKYNYETIIYEKLPETSKELPFLSFC